MKDARGQFCLLAIQMINIVFIGMPFGLVPEVIKFYVRINIIFFVFYIATFCAIYEYMFKASRTLQVCRLFWFNLFGNSLPKCYCVILHYNHSFVHTINHSVKHCANYWPLCHSVFVTLYLITVLFSVQCQKSKNCFFMRSSLPTLLILSYY